MKRQMVALVMTLAIVVAGLPQEVSAAELKENPIKSFKLGTKDFSSAFSAKKFKKEFGMIIAKQRTLKLKKKQNKVKVSVKMKKGYKLKSISKTSFHKVKNGKVMKLADYEREELYMYIEYLDKGNSKHKLCLPVKITRK